MTLRHVSRDESDEEMAIVGPLAQWGQYVSEIYRHTDALEGGGSIITVVAEYQLADGRRAAIKTMSGDLSIHALREIVSLRLLNSPDVVPLWGAVADEQQWGVVTPLARGDLADMRSQLSEIQLRRISYQIVRGVAYLFARDVWHRDIKPNNVLIFPSGDSWEYRAQISDFGVARLGACVARDLKYTRLVETILYRAPEILLGGRYTPASESWALGMLLLETLVGIRIGHHASADIMFFQYEKGMVEFLISWFGPIPLGEMSVDVASRHERFGRAPRGLFELRRPPFDKIPDDIYRLLSRLLNYIPRERAEPSAVLNDPVFGDVRETHLEPAALDCSALVREFALPASTLVSPLNPQDRLLLHEWMIDVCENYSLSTRTHHLSIQIFERHVRSGVPLTAGTLQAMAASALYLASSLHDVAPIRLNHLVYMTADAYSASDLRRTTTQILTTLNADVYRTTSYDYVLAVSSRYPREVVTVAELIVLWFSFSAIANHASSAEVAETALWVACRSQDETYLDASGVEARRSQARAIVDELSRQALKSETTVNRFRRGGQSITYHLVRADLLDPTLHRETVSPLHLS